MSDSKKSQIAKQASDAHDQYRLGLIAGISDDDLQKIMLAFRDGRVVVLPCKVGQTIYLVKEDLLNCDECPNKTLSQRDKDGYRWIGCPDADRRCPVYVEEKTAEGFEVHGKDGVAVLSDPGEYGWEGLERLVGIDDKYHLSKPEAEEAARALSASEVK